MFKVSSKIAYSLVISLAAHRVLGVGGWDECVFLLEMGVHQMNLQQQRDVFDREAMILDRAILTFEGVDGFDVYNTSIPFDWQGQTYMFGRVERRDQWARSWSRLFVETGKDHWKRVPDAMMYQMEDPFVSHIQGQLVLGGNLTRYVAGAYDTYYVMFYRGQDLHDLHYFTTGPDFMKDIRLVELENEKIGVFSRPRSEQIMQQYGCESQVGFTIIDSLDGLTPAVVENARYIPGLYDKGEWGGCNQACLLDENRIGVIGHKCYNRIDPQGVKISTYLNVSFVFDIQKHIASDFKIIGTRSSYPSGPAKSPGLIDCAFTSGMVLRKDGKADLYSGIGDVQQGRITIDDPFAAYRKVMVAQSAVVGNVVGNI